MNTDDLRAEVVRAEERVAPFKIETPLARSVYLSALTGADVSVKLENLQHTGSFKVRGALNAVLSMDSGEGVVTASTGNHGAAVAYALGVTETPGIVFVPENASASKTERIVAGGCEVRRYGTDALETELFARRFAAENSMHYISPYNDPAVIAGQGTIGLELERQTGAVDALFASVGGGGMISGIAGYLKPVFPELEIVGCSPDNSKVMAESVRAGVILDIPSLPTLSDGTAGGLEPGAITFPLCSKLVDRFVTVDEELIGRCLIDFIEAEGMIIEGAAAVAIGGLLSSGGGYGDRKIVVVICGGNIDEQTLKSIR